MVGSVLLITRESDWGVVMRSARALMLISLIAATVGVSAMPSEAKVPRCFGKRATIVGTRQNDGLNNHRVPTRGALKGTRHADVIVGLGGNDRIHGKGGNDLICGNRGQDTLRGGKGRDRIASGRGGPQLFGSSGGEEFMNGGRGADRLKGTFASANHIFGGRGADVIRGLGLVNRFGCERVCIEMLSGGPGPDRIYAGRTRDEHRQLMHLRGGVGPDLLRGDMGDDLLFGGPGDDTLDGRDGDNSNDGGDGMDVCLNPTIAEGALNCES